jgi:hypothetical protein
MLQRFREYLKMKGDVREHLRKVGVYGLRYPRIAGR